MKKLLLTGFSLLSFLTHGQKKEWNCAMKIQDEQIRFTLQKSESGEMCILNGEETILMERKTTSADSVEFSLSIFDAALVLPKKMDGVFQGWYRKGDAKIPSKGLLMEAIPGTTSRPVISGNAAENSRWPLEFLEEGKVSETGILVLSQSGNNLKGSILTESGDYRFLNGERTGNKAYLQTFDGGHAYYFRMEFQPDGSLAGDFLYSQTGRQAFRGKRNDAASLASGFSGTSSGRFLHFTGKDEQGNVLTQENFKGKAMVLQVLGSWCPNCLDETRFLTEEYAGKPAAVTFLGLAFERKNDPVYAGSRIATVKRKLAVPYPILWSGMANRDSASAVLPEAGGIKAFPTTIFIRKNGSIHSIHSGFSGPATGSEYATWRNEFRRLLKEISD